VTGTTKEGLEVELAVDSAWKKSHKMSLKEFVDGSLMLNWAFNLGLNKRTTVFLKPILTKPIQPRSCLGLDCSFCLGCLCTRVGCGSPLALIFKKNGISGRFQTHIACHCMINKCVSSGECFFTYPGIFNWGLCCLCVPFFDPS
jgi:hypothetical protein